MTEAEHLPEAALDGSPDAAQAAPAPILASYPTDQTFRTFAQVGLQDHGQGGGGELVDDLFENLLNVPALVGNPSQGIPHLVQG